MALEDYREEMERCCRCSACKFIPMDIVDSYEYVTVCPSIARYNFHAYSGGGRLNVALGMLDGRVPYSEEVLNIIYRCQMCGACDISCKYNRDMEPLETLYALRIRAVEEGQLLPDHLAIIEGLRKEDNMVQGLKADRGKWAEGLDVKNISKEKTEVLFHAGCRYSFDQELWPLARAAINLIKKAGIDVGIAGREEVCCGGRAYAMGYEGELIKYAEHNGEIFKQAGAKTLVTCCADGYQAFKVMYDKVGKKLDLQVFHISEYLDLLIKQGNLKPTKKGPMVVTYHDPCHLGRLAESYIHWKGELKIEPDKPILHVPPKKFRRGHEGVYEPPRNILRNIPGLRFVEMKRIKEHAWCCGAGGGVLEAYPDFAIWSALQRIEEAECTGAEAIVTACPWCKKNFSDAIKQNGNRIKVYDLIELLATSTDAELK